MKLQQTEQQLPLLQNTALLKPRGMDAPHVLSNNTVSRTWCLHFKLAEFDFLCKEQGRQFSVVVFGPFEPDCFMSHI